jgi:hypothetical protein
LVGLTPAENKNPKKRSDRRNDVVDVAHYSLLSDEFAIFFSPNHPLAEYFFSYRDDSSDSITSNIRMKIQSSLAIFLSWIVLKPSFCHISKGTLGTFVNLVLGFGEIFSEQHFWSSFVGC